MRALFTTRWGGVSAGPWSQTNLGPNVGDEETRVLANRDLLQRSVGDRAIRWARQVHGANVAVVPGPEPRGGFDAVVTATPDLPLAVLVADCLPVLFADAEAGVAAAAHAGRRGLAAGVLQRAVAAMVRLGAHPARVRAVIGPAVGGCCYEVPEALQAEIAGAVPATVASTSWGTTALDLPAGAIAVLRAVGVSRVQWLGACTVEDDRFYSYRRDGVTGRFAGLVMLDR